MEGAMEDLQDMFIVHTTDEVQVGLLTALQSHTLNAICEILVSFHSIAAVKINLLTIFQWFMFGCLMLYDE